MKEVDVAWRSTTLFLHFLLFCVSQRDMVKFKEKRAESCHAQMSTFFGTLINKMQPSVDKMFVTPQRASKHGRQKVHPGWCQKEKSFIFVNFPLLSKSFSRKTAEEQWADSSLGTGFRQGRWSNQKMVLTNPHSLQKLVFRPL